MRWKLTTCWWSQEQFTCIKTQHLCEAFIVSSWAFEDSGRPQPKRSEKRANRKHINMRTQTHTQTFTHTHTHAQCFGMPSLSSSLSSFEGWLNSHIKVQVGGCHFKGGGNNYIMLLVLPLIYSQKKGSTFSFHYTYALYTTSSFILFIDGGAFNMLLCLS